MHKDKLIKTALENNIPELSPNFNNDLLERIVCETQKTEKKKQIFNYLLVSIISAALIALAAYLLKDKVTVANLIEYKRFFKLSYKSPVLIFSLLMSVISLSLLLLDGYLRHLHRRHVSKNEMPPV